MYDVEKRNVTMPLPKQLNTDLLTLSEDEFKEVMERLRLLRELI